MTNQSNELRKILHSLGQAIRVRRLSMGLSQESLADLTGFDRTYVSLIERGERNPSFINVCRFAGAMNMTPSDLLKGITPVSQKDLRKHDTKP